MMKVPFISKKTGRQFFTFRMTESDYQSYDDQSFGLCVACGATNDCHEPDARKYQCENCGKHSSYGTSELLVMGGITLIEEKED